MICMLVPGEPSKLYPRGVNPLGNCSCCLQRICKMTNPSRTILMRSISCVRSRSGANAWHKAGASRNSMLNLLNLTIEPAMAQHSRNSTWQSRPLVGTLLQFLKQRQSNAWLWAPSAMKHVKQALPLGNTNICRCYGIHRQPTYCTTSYTSLMAISLGSA